LKTAGKTAEEAEMSFDHIWLCPSLKREEWVEVFTRSRKLISCPEIFSEEAMEKEQRRYGNFKVAVSMGGNSSCDELYHFLFESDALRFFRGGPLEPGEQGYRDREYYDEEPGPGGRGIGDRVLDTGLM
jgi:hypothetical protein